MEVKGIHASACLSFSLGHRHRVVYNQRGLNLREQAEELGGFRQAGRFSKIKSGPSIRTCGLKGSHGH